MNKHKSEKFNKLHISLGKQINVEMSVQQQTLDTIALKSINCKCSLLNCKICKKWAQINKSRTARRKYKSHWPAAEENLT